MLNYNMSECQGYGQFMIMLVSAVQVLSLIKSCPEPQGISIQELKQRLSGISMNVIRYVFFWVFS